MTVAAEPLPLVRDLLIGLAGLVHPHGSVDAPGHRERLRGRASGTSPGSCAHAGRRGGAAQLPRGLLAEYWMQAGGVHESVTRRMLASSDAAGEGGALQPEARALVAGRHFKARPSSSPLVPYTEEEWERLHQVCRQVADEAFARHRQALRPAARGQDPRDGGWTAGNQRWLLMRLGPAERPAGRRIPGPRRDMGQQARRDTGSER